MMLQLKIRTVFFFFAFDLHTFRERSCAAVLNPIDSACSQSADYTYSHSKTKRPLSSTRALNRLLAKSLKLNATKNKQPSSASFKLNWLFVTRASFSASELKQIKVCFFELPYHIPMLRFFLSNLVSHHKATNTELHR
uniref:(northern house mosquito) hypothetical protein n=1 Tax=Culex pipiens TaxID=7175 RepID=A0A8D8K1G5_CULPI